MSDNRQDESVKGPGATLRESEASAAKGEGGSSEKLGHEPVDLLSALDAFSRLEGLEDEEDDIDLDEEDDYSDLRPISEWEGDDEDDEDEGPRPDPEDVMGIRGLLEEDDGLGEMFFQALLSAREGELADANVFAEKLVEVFNETPRPELGGQSPDRVYASLQGPPPSKSLKGRQKELDDDEPLRKPRARGRARSPLPGDRGPRDSL